jgi:hypothetical protein
MDNNITREVAEFLAYLTIPQAVESNMDKINVMVKANELLKKIKYDDRIVRNYEVLDMQIDLFVNPKEPKGLIEKREAEAFKSFGSAILKGKIYEHERKDLGYAIRDNYFIKILKLRE